MTKVPYIMVDRRRLTRTTLPQVLWLAMWISQECKAQVEVLHKAEGKSPIRWLVVNGE